MAERKVGIRELKAQLSSYIREIKKGHSFVITERGQTVGRIAPAHASSEERLHDLVRGGIAAWNGKMLTARDPVVRLKRGRKTLSQIVSENRD